MYKYESLKEFKPKSCVEELYEAHKDIARLEHKLSVAQTENRRLKSKNAQLARRIREVKYPMKSEPVQTLSEREVHSERKDYLNKRLHYKDGIRREPNGQFKVFYTYSLIPQDVSKLANMSALNQYGIYKVTNTRQEAEEFLYDAVEQLYKIVTDGEK